MSVRVDGWQTKYNVAVAAMSEWPFRWGEHDCITFAARIADAVTGGRYLEGVRAKYQWSSALEAARAIKDAGRLEAMITEFLGEPVPWGWCTTGDVVLATNRDGGEIVAVMDSHYLLAPEETRLGGLPLHAAIKGWRL